MPFNTLKENFCVSTSKVNSLSKIHEELLKNCSEEKIDNLIKNRQKTQKFSKDYIQMANKNMKIHSISLITREIKEIASQNHY